MVLKKIGIDEFSFTKLSELSRKLRIKKGQLLGMIISNLEVGDLKEIFSRYIDSVVKQEKGEENPKKEDFGENSSDESEKEEDFDEKEYQNVLSTVRTGKKMAKQEDENT